MWIKDRAARFIVRLWNLIAEKCVIHRVPREFNDVENDPKPKAQSPKPKAQSPRPKLKAKAQSPIADTPAATTLDIQGGSDTLVMAR
ncbi:hypothetical protein [Pantoea sp. SM3]|uniref:hypothetical protein n=1 Tax=Pantoea sp. SM3 TaxID=1628192 RepID=UPI0005F7CBE8|nr:hypothetical protein [Pantoea sp. SM3]KJV28781.1 hypothetical protein VI01_16820 [Pantoea sp. SM3]